MAHAWPLWTHEVCALQISPDGRVLASLGADGTLRLADLELGRPSHAVEFGPGCRALAMGSAVVAVGGDGGVRLVNAHAGRVTQTLRTRAPVIDLAMSVDGVWLAAVDADGDVRLWRAASGRRVADHRGIDVVAVALGWGTEPLWWVTAGGVLHHGAAGPDTPPAVALTALRARLRAVHGRWGGLVGLDASGGLCAASGALDGAPTGLVDADASPEGDLWLVGADGVTRWPSGETWSAAVRRVAVHPEGSCAAVALHDGGVGMVRGRPLGEPIGSP